MPRDKIILVVEDDEPYRKLVTSILEHAGFKVLSVNNFASAMPVIESDQRLHLLLIDIGLPVGTPQGISIALMAQSRRPTLKVLYMSGYHHIEQVRPLIGDAGFLPKPFRAAQLIELIEKALAA